MSMRCTLSEVEDSEVADYMSFSECKYRFPDDLREQMKATDTDTNT